MIARTSAMIWKQEIPWPIAADGRIELDLPSGAKILDFALLPDPVDVRGAPRPRPAIWFLFAAPSLELEKRTFIACATGERFPEHRGRFVYIGTAPIRREFDVLVVHLFELLAGPDGVLG